MSHDFSYQEFLKFGNVTPVFLAQALLRKFCEVSMTKVIICLPIILISSVSHSRSEDRVRRSRPDVVKELRRSTDTRRGNERSKRITNVVTGNPIYSGDGCPANTAQVSFAVDNLSFSILFDQFVAESSSSTRKREALACHILVPIQIPEDTQMEITRVDLRGYVQLPIGAQAVMRSSFNFRGRDRDRSQLIVSSRWQGPKMENFDLTSEALREEQVKSSTEISPCGGLAYLVIRNQLSILSENTQDEALLSLDSIDGIGRAEYFVNWKSCR